MVNVRAPLMLLLLILGSFLFRLWNMSQVFNACRMHSLPLTTECSALAREKERTWQRERVTARLSGIAGGSDELHAPYTCLPLSVCDCISATQFWIFLSVFFTFVTNALDTHSWAHIRRDENFTLSCIRMWLLKAFALWDIAITWEQNWNILFLWKNYNLLRKNLPIPFECGSFYNLE